jgi:hypothetical protein
MATLSRVTATGEPLGECAVSLADQMALGGGPGGLALVTGNGLDLVVYSIDPVTCTAGPEHPLTARDTSGSSFPVLAASAGGWGVTWQDTRGGSSEAMFALACDAR